MNILHQLHAQGTTIVMVTHETDCGGARPARDLRGRMAKVIPDGRDGHRLCLGQAVKAEMKLSEMWKTAWEPPCTLNKVRSFLTTLGVIIGAASVIIMLAVSAGAEAAIADQINGLGAN